MKGEIDFGVRGLNIPDYKRIGWRNKKKSIFIK